ncbi:hypothetical protein C8R45DRAFT_1213309 [Mycena sanguinolenta]|nr:hypothetical protein C8R45DRAFT_1213309 [Mycena sanguinolenta]
MARAGSTMIQILALTLVALRWAPVSAAPAPALVTLVNPLGDTSTPISASILGTDAAGRTTYAFAHATPPGPGQNFGRTEIETVVAGSGYFSLTDELVVGSTTEAVGAELVLAKNTIRKI